MTIYRLRDKASGMMQGRIYDTLEAVRETLILDWVDAVNLDVMEADEDRAEKAWTYYVQADIANSIAIDAAHSIEHAAAEYALYETDNTMRKAVAALKELYNEGAIEVAKAYDMYRSVWSVVDED